MTSDRKTVNNVEFVVREYALLSGREKLGGKAFPRN